MRNVSFTLTTQQILDRTKTVTRRTGWKWSKPGMLLMGCKKVMGRRKFEPIENLAIIRVTNVRTERLDAITADDVRAEGFPGMDPAEFVAMFCTCMGCFPETEVRRIEFTYIPGGCTRRPKSFAERCEDVGAAQRALNMYARR